MSRSFLQARTISLPSTRLVKVVGVRCWSLRGLNLSSSLYTFQYCNTSLDRDCHFTDSPELTHSLLEYFCSRGTPVSAGPLCLPIPPRGHTINFISFKLIHNVKEQSDCTTVSTQSHKNYFSRTLCVIVVNALCRFSILFVIIDELQMNVKNYFWHPGSATIRELRFWRPIFCQLNYRDKCIPHTHTNRTGGT